MNKPEFTVDRTEGYIGVLVDDLTTQGTNEPYRMFTSRAEFRLSLRPDNADMRLTDKGYEIGCVSEERFRLKNATHSKMQEAIAFLETIKKPLNVWGKILKVQLTSTSTQNK